MNKTVYVKDEDGPIWDKARELSGDKLSSFIMDTLRAFVSEHEHKAQGFQRIVLRFYEDNLPRAKAFIGRWIFPPETPLRCHWEDSSGEDCTPNFLVAETPKGNYAVLEFHPMPEASEEGEYTIDGYYRFARFYVVQSIEEMSHAISSVLATSVMKRLGVQV